MRVSTSQFFQISRNNMSKLQSDLSEQVKYLSSGKRILTAKDSPVESSTLQSYKDELMSIDKFKSNITQAENKNQRMEVSLSSAQDILMNAQQSLIQANNGAYSAEDLLSLARDLESSLDQLVEIANTKSESGDYIFSGYQSSTKPFSKDTNNNVTYAGDNGTTKLQISSEIRIDTSQPGDEAFLKVQNSVGDFSASYIDNPTPPAIIDPDEPDIRVEKAVISDRNTYNGSGMVPGLTFDFADINADGIVEVTVTDATPAVVHGPVNYTPGTPISFNGVDLSIDGNPLPGDQFTINEQEEISVFDTLQSVVGWVEILAKGNLADPKQHQVDYEHLITQLNESFGHITNKRAEVGVSLKNIDTQLNIHADVELMIKTAAGKIENLDFAAAVTDFEQRKVSLQAAQQTFSQIQNLSLFNYI